MANEEEQADKAVPLKRKYPEDLESNFVLFSTSLITSYSHSLKCGHLLSWVTPRRRGNGLWSRSKR